MSVLPQRARLVVQRQPGDPLGEFGKVEFARVEVGILVGLAHQAVAVEAVGDAGGMAHQVENGSSSLILPSWINCIATTEVIALVSDDRRKMVLSLIGALDTASWTPKVS